MIQNFEVLFLICWAEYCGLEWCDESVAITGSAIPGLPDGASADNRYRPAGGTGGSLGGGCAATSLAAGRVSGASKLILLHTDDINMKI